MSVIENSSTNDIRHITAQRPADNELIETGVEGKMTQQTLESLWAELVTAVGKQTFGLTELDDSMPLPAIDDIVHGAIEAAPWIQSGIEPCIERLLQMRETAEDGSGLIAAPAAETAVALVYKDLMTERIMRRWWAEIHVTWQTEYFSRGVKHPMAPLICAWFERKPDSTPREYGSGFFPSRLAAHERKRTAFGLPARIQRREGEEIALPDFGSDRRMPALPEELLALGKVRGGGRGAQLPIRATLAGIEFAPPHSRNSFYTMPVRDFLRRLYPSGYPRGRRWYLELARVAEVQAAARVPYRDPDTGQTGTTIPVMIMRIPDSLDGDLRIAVDLPPKSEQGAPITDNLYAYGANNSRAFYALLQLAVDWWQPGKTRIPVSKRRGIWTQLTDSGKKAHIERYEPYDRNQIVELTAPLTTHKTKRNAYLRGMETLNNLNDAGELVLLPDGNDIWRIMPPPRK